jgi:tRNA threonylcarbamoyl adenosine modification protein YjeE
MALLREADRVGLVLADEAATARLAQDIAAVLRPGDLVALSGGLGAGKTSFARALIRAIAGDSALEVPSPTFPLRIEHALARLRVVHADLYRIGDPAELDELGFDEALEDAVLLVEWPELLPSRLAENRLDVALEIAASARRATLTGYGTWPARLARTRAVREFLDRSGWPGATRTPLAGDASSRAYERVRDARAAAILMNAPTRAEGPAIYGGRSYDAVAHRALDVRSFVAIDVALREAGVRAPEILAADIEAGLLLLEDLGGELVVDRSGAPILERYEAAIDLLVHMHGRSWPAEAELPDGSTYRLPPYDREALLVEISLFPDWFGGNGGEPAFPKEARADFLAAWSRVLDRLGPETTWVMRDFHSPNILWQPDASGIRRVGVIDFQDALVGHPAYDVASLAQDARVPLATEHERRLKARYVAGRQDQDPGFDPEYFETAYAILALQRATKVLGIFTRLALAEGKPGYQRHRARLKELIHCTLSHPVLSGLRLWYEPYIGGSGDREWDD